MSQQADDSEGLSPAPVNLLDLFAGDDEDDDDMYEPASEQSSGLTAEEEEDDDDDEGDGAQASLNGIQIIFQDAEDGDEDDGDQTETERGTGQPTAARTTTISLADIQRLIGTHPSLRRLMLGGLINRDNWAAGGDDDDDDDDDDFNPYQRRRRRRRPTLVGDRYPKIPSETGRALMNSGHYGQRDSYVDVARKRRKNVSERLMWRRLGDAARPSVRKQNNLLAQQLIPATSLPDRIIHYDSRAYSGQFSDDGNFFFSCTQNFKVRLYDTSNPYDWKYYKTVDYPFGQWTITDATLSPDNRWLAYSSIRHTVCLASTEKQDDNMHTLLDFTNFSGSAGGSQRGYGYMGRNGFGIWSLRFSGDGREIVAGTSGHSVVVFDLERRQSIVQLSQHDDDVNAVCFGDKSSPHILYSGSDDQTVRVWDRRSMADGRPAGVFVGHTEGITYVDSKGDGRYVLSNGKDQLMKLWDLRKMWSANDFANIDLASYTTNFDYRFNVFDEDSYVPNPKDCSVVTFRGHSVLKTLIRCHFSPAGSSNSRYVYSGSEDGKVWVWNLDGSPKATIDVAAGTRGTRPRGDAAGGYGYELNGRGGGGWATCVRDASWSPTAPVLAATSWNGHGMSTGTVSLHSWNEARDSDEADPPMPTNYNARLDVRDDYNAAQAAWRREQGRRAERDSTMQELRARRLRGGLRSSAVRRAAAGDDDDDDDDDRGGGGGAVW